MKRLICLLAVIALAAALCSCGRLVQVPSNDTAPSDTQTAAPEASAGSDDGADTVSEPPADVSEEKTDGAAEAKADEAAEAKADETAGENTEESSSSNQLWDSNSMFTFGTVDGDVYENSFLGYGCRLENWTFAGEEEIAALNNWGRETLTEDYRDLIASMDIIIDMSAASEDGLKNVVIQFQKTDVGSLIGDELLVDLSIPAVTTSLEDQGYNDLNVEKTLISLGEDEYFGIYITGEFYGIPVFQKQAVIRCGDQIAYIAATSAFDDEVDDIFASFYELSE
ncbi:MAG: hypothetical protein K5855_09170 [Oscillospiraceae bacterium]|nr:hypothetical protein [Oscillospiraceae bacterium]